MVGAPVGGAVFAYSTWLTACVAPGTGDQVAEAADFRSKVTVRPLAETEPPNFGCTVTPATGFHFVAVAGDVAFRVHDDALPMRPEIVTGVASTPAPMVAAPLIRTPPLVVTATPAPLATVSTPARTRSAAAKVPASATTGRPVTSVSGPESAIRWPSTVSVTASRAVRSFAGSAEVLACAILTLRRPGAAP